MKQIIETAELEGVELLYTYEPAADAPTQGSDWEDRIDLPGVRLTVTITGPLLWSNCQRSSEYIDDRFVSPSTRVMGETLNNKWGTGDGKGGRRIFTIVREATLEASLAEARHLALVAYSTLRKVVDARNTRLAKRDATIARAEAVNPFADDPQPAAQPA